MTPSVRWSRRPDGDNVRVRVEIWAKCEWTNVGQIDLRDIPKDQGETVSSDLVVDQAGLDEVLGKMRDLESPLVSINRMETGDMVQ